MRKLLLSLHRQTQIHTLSFSFHKSYNALTIRLQKLMLWTMIKRNCWATVSDESYGKNCHLDNFVFISPSLSYQRSEAKGKTCVKLCYWFATLYRERERGGGDFKHTFKIPIMFCNWLSEISKKERKMRFYACCFK